MTKQEAIQQRQMASYTVREVMDSVTGDVDDLDSGGESDIAEDLPFPCPEPVAVKRKTLTLTSRHSYSK